MKNSLSILMSVLIVSACSATAPDKPNSFRSSADQVQGASADQVADEDHANHMDHQMDPNAPAAKSPTAPAGTVSARADDMELIKAWTKGQYLGNETLKLSFQAATPL